MGCQQSTAYTIDECWCFNWISLCVVVFIAKRRRVHRDNEDKEHHQCRKLSKHLTQFHIVLTMWSRLVMYYAYLAVITLPDATQQNCFVELNRVGRCDPFKDSTRQNCFVELSWAASGDAITLKTQPDSFWSNFRSVGASGGVLNISELVEASRRQSGDVITFTTRKTSVASRDLVLASDA